MFRSQYLFVDCEGSPVEWVGFIIVGKAGIEIISEGVTPTVIAIGQAVQG